MSTMIEPINTNHGTKEPIKKIQTLGSVRQRDEHTNEIILIPTPSQDPNDPLNWSKPRKYYMAILICLAMFMCNFLAAGPSVAILETALEFFPPIAGPDGISAAIAKTAYFFTTTSLLQGTGNLVWMPLVNKYGRRPIYIASYTLYFAVALWLSFTKVYGSFLAARILMGLASGAAETMAPLSIADVFFLHERGAVMAMYTSALSCGVAGGMIIAGLITIHNTWRTIYYVGAALIGTLLILVIFTFPETSYIRDITPTTSSSETGVSDEKLGTTSIELAENGSRTIPKCKTYLQNLKLFSGIYTNESLLDLFLRPIALVVLPPVLWGSLVMSVTIGFLVAVSSNVAPAFDTAYGFVAWQTGLCFISAIIGSLIGIFAGGHLSDKVTDYFTKRNGGLREPEMRLPAIAISLITTPLGLILFGVGIQNKLHWICPTIGLGLLNFSIVQATNVSLVYTIDCYRPIAGEVTVTSMALKSCFGFLLSFYTNPWIEKVGYLNAYGTMAGIAAAILLFAIPIYIFGKRIRHATWHWSVVKYVHWDDDREVGE
ncbi:hypothetical protein ONS95_006465 [Cadophora gregata]|uniref:uncharacterized protein n=1 Tax=Cadophora gregata TaxID=51156 RepID=UPI0026DC82BB|nr:uncharacterized protein ONS95_006465 [Cadophora gregata]KAK0101288.1 hypothetical protein ONS95_006465 [Cadophora gregata]KAK0106702.1 hypothetical protein ONS96_004321 [Cadophora gregata f. sp. sojae]